MDLYAQTYAHTLMHSHVHTCAHTTTNTMGWLWHSVGVVDLRLKGCRFRSSFAFPSVDGQSYMLIWELCHHQCVHAWTLFACKALWVLIKIENSYLSMHHLKCMCAHTHTCAQHTHWYSHTQTCTVWTHMCKLKQSVLLPIHPYIHGTCDYHWKQSIFTQLVIMDLVEEQKTLI